MNKDIKNAKLRLGKPQNEEELNHIIGLAI